MSKTNESAKEVIRRWKNSEERKRFESVIHFFNF
jgi:hypothetical protein